MAKAKNQIPDHWFGQFLHNISDTSKIASRNGKKISPYGVSVAIIKDKEPEINKYLTEHNVEHSNKTLLEKAVLYGNMHQDMHYENTGYLPFDYDDVHFNADGSGGLTDLFGAIGTVVGYVANHIKKPAKKVTPADVAEADNPDTKKKLDNGSGTFNYQTQSGDTYQTTIGKDGVESFSVDTDKLHAESKNITAGKIGGYIAYGVAGIILIVVLIVVLKKGKESK